MNVHVASSTSVAPAFKQGIRIFGFDPEHDDLETADVVIVDSKQKLQKLYRDDQRFVVISTQEPDSLPSNAVWFNVSEAVVKVAEHLHDVYGEIIQSPNRNTKIRTGVVHEPSQENKVSALDVLVIDDTTENLIEAINRLAGSHYLTLARGYDEGAKLIEENEYDAVLSDCRMPVGTYHSALSVDAVSLDETVHNGPYLMFKATQKGARFAVVTDANHHNDWASAMFDDLREAHTVNGQPILFINYMEKQWDQALQKLMGI